MGHRRKKEAARAKRKKVGEKRKYEIKLEAKKKHIDVESRIKTRNMQNRGGILDGLMRKTNREKLRARGKKQRTEYKKNVNQGTRRR